MLELELKFVVVEDSEEDLEDFGKTEKLRGLVVLSEILKNCGLRC